VAEARRGLYDRVYAAIPLALVFLLLCILYAWQSAGHESPWLFGDELELTQISRAIAATGHAARRGQPYGFHTLYTYLLAPAWLLHSTTAAYTVVKYIGVFTMTAAVFPAYFLARLVSGPRASLFAAAATGAAPALVYSTMILPEPLAYPWAALTLFLIVKGLGTRSRGWLGAAAVATILAPFVRSQLAVLFAVFALAALYLAWTSDRAARWRSSWSRGDWLGAVVLGIGAIILFSAVVSSHYHEWLVATGYYRGRMIEYGLWAAGSLTIGLGILPVLAALSALGRAREPRTPELRAFVAVLFAGLVSFGLYTAVKAAYISTTFETRIEERNLIYLAPLLFAATALWLERPRLRIVPLAAAVGFVAYLIVSTPYALDNVPYSDAFGLSILALSNRDLSFASSGVEWLLISVLVLSVALLLAPRVLERRRALASGVLALTAFLVVAWNLTGEIAGSNYSNSYSRQIVQNFPRPLDWLDALDHRRPALYLGQGLTSGANLGVNLSEFWNRSLKQFWSLDGTAPGPGPVLTPNLAAVDGRLFPDPGYPYVMVEPGIDLVGKELGPFGRWRVFEVTPPLRLAHSETGIFSDGQTGCSFEPCPAALSAYNQYSTPGGRSGWVAVSISRLGSCGAPIKPGHVVIRLGRLIRGQDKQPHLGAVRATRTWTVAAGYARTVVIPSGRPPFRVEVSISPTYSPADYGASDRRALGAQVGFSFGQGPLPSETQQRCR
jgi:hypothetical protein